MRLTPREREAIAAAARQTLQPGTRVSLFGSRVDDSARGGDIDLLLEPSTAPDVAGWVAQRTRLHRLAQPVAQAALGGGTVVHGGILPERAHLVHHRNAEPLADAQRRDRVQYRRVRVQDAKAHAGTLSSAAVRCVPDAAAPPSRLRKKASNINKVHSGAL